jgi:hypothetical protein
MTGEVIRTGVDELLDLLAHSAKVPLTEAASKLKIDAGVIQAWADFLVEEGIIGIEYKFTTPYIYLNKVVEKKPQEKIEKQENYNVQYFKKEFWERARAGNIPENQVEQLWRNHVTQALELIKKYFFFEAQQKKLGETDKLWNEYKELIYYA